MQKKWPHRFHQPFTEVVTVVYMSSRSCRCFSIFIAIFFEGGQNICQYAVSRIRWLYITCSSRMRSQTLLCLPLLQPLFACFHVHCPPKITPHEFAEPFGHASLDFMDDVASEQMGGFGAFDSWMYIPECAADGTADNYEPESPVETLLGDIPALKVSGPAQVEHAWQQCAMAAQSKRRRLVQPQAAWEHSPFNMVFRTGDRWHGTALANLSDMFQPAWFWCCRCFCIQIWWTTAL